MRDLGPLKEFKQALRRFRVPRARRHRDGVSNQQRFGAEGQRGDGRAIPLLGGDVVRVGQTDPRFAARHKLRGDGIAIDEERFVRLQRPAPQLPVRLAPTLAQREEMGDGGAEQRVRQRDFAAPDLVGDFLYAVRR